MHATIQWCVLQKSCRSVFREEQNNGEYQQSGVPLLFWKVKLMGQEMVLAKVRYFSHDEVPIPNTDLVGIKLDGNGAGVYVTEPKAWNNASYTLCDLCSLAEDVPELGQCDKVLVGFEK